MISCSDLYQIYDRACFEHYDDSFCVKEKGSSASLKKVVFMSSSGIFGGDKLLKESLSIYFGGKDGKLNFKQNCDGFAITQHNGKLYLIWIELKSGFNGIKFEALGQIAHSYLKIKHHLMMFTSFATNHEEYKEFAIVISHSPSAHFFHQMSNDDVAERRLTISSTHKSQAIVNKYRTELRDNGETVLRGVDFGYDKLKNIQKPLILEHLPLVHIAIDDEQGSVDLSKIIERLQSSPKIREIL